MTQTIPLERFNYAPEGTFGRLRLPSGRTLYTVERPWLGNRQQESCIPDGVYRLSKRPSPVVERTSRGAYTEGWEVADVPGRTFIMLHPGNWPRNVKGCIAVGTDYRILEGQQAVTDSQMAFAQLMDELNAGDDWELLIHPYIMEYP